MRIVSPDIGARAIDSYSPITPDHADALLGAGIQCVGRYTDNLSGGEFQMLLGKKFLVFFITTSPANAYVPTVALAQQKHQAALMRIKALGVGPGATSFVDLEGMGGDFQSHIDYANAALGAMTPYCVGGVYVGDAVGLTSKELYDLPQAVRYWKSESRVQDRFGQIAEPQCGWAICQAYPGNVVINGVQVDVDMCQEDYQGRRITCVSA